MQEIVLCENAIIHTLAFDFDIIHPHYSIISFCSRLQLPKDMTKVAYTLGTYILILSNMCVRYKPSVLACVCINLVYRCVKEPARDAEEGQISEVCAAADIDMNLLDGCKWATRFDPSLDSQLLERLTTEYQNAIQRTPNDLKKDLINQTFPDKSQINPLISSLLFKNAKQTLALAEEQQQQPVEAENK